MDTDKHGVLCKGAFQQADCRTMEVMNAQGYALRDQPHPCLSVCIRGSALV